MKTVWIIHLLLLNLLIVRSSSGQKLQGHVKSYNDCYYSVRESFGKIKKGQILIDSILHNQHVFLDHNGNVVQMDDYHDDGTIDCKYEGRINDGDNNLESFFVRFYPEITLDRKPFILASADFSWGGMCEMTYKDDKNGLPAEETIHDLEGRVLFKISFQRDSIGNVLEENISDGTDNIYKYDSRGNRIEFISRIPGGNTITTTYVYDKYGNIVEKHINNYFNSRYKFRYEDFIYTYQYDSTGNWITRMEYENLKPQRMMLRTIEYFDDFSP